jgi:REP element-mobilizing transposase RayT
MVLNELGQKLNELIMEIPNHNSYAQIPVFQVMPNHVHLIVCIDGGGDDGGRIDDGRCRDAACHVSTGETNETPDCTDAACHVSTMAGNKKMRAIADRCGLLSTAMGGLTSALTKFVNLNKIEVAWQERFHDHIIRDKDEMNRIATYIEQNPTNWKNDKFYTE